MHTLRSFALASLLPCLLLLLPSCSSREKRGEEADASSAPVVTVAVDTVALAPMEVTVVAYGTTEALRKEKVSAPLAGRIIRLHAFEGTPVRRGDLLAVIMTKESQAALLGAQTMLRSATTPEQRAEAERLVSLARSAGHEVTLTASFDGIVATRAVSEGELVTEDQELCSVIDPATVTLFADVPLRELPAVRQGNRARIVFPALGPAIFPARVEALSPQATREGQTVRVRLALIGLSPSLRALLRTGMNGTATIVTGVVPRATVVPRGALLRNDENDTYAVVTVTADSLARHIPVTCGIIGDSVVQVSGPGIRPGLTVVTDGQYALADSTRIRVAGRAGR